LRGNIKAFDEEEMKKMVMLERLASKQQNKN
jgi:hypothetical protein